jgi:hypothetical protein
MRLVRVRCDAQGEMTISWYPFDEQGRPDYDNPLQRPYPLPRAGIKPVGPAMLDMVVEDDYSQIYTVLVPEGGLAPWLFHYLYESLWEHVLVVKHFLPPAPTPDDIQRLDSLTTSHELC